MLDADQSLYVYELRGGIPPAFLDLEGLLGVWPEADYTYLFFTSPADGALKAFLRRHPEFHLTSRYRMRYGEWQQLAGQEPLVIDRFRVITGEQSVLSNPDEILLRIDPGVIFGSGLHPTTRGCLRALSSLYSEGRPARVLDLGTGTGILAIAAALLGAERVEGLDLNPMAVSTARSNCLRNGVADRVMIRMADAREQLPEADLLCVNIHFDFLRTFLDGDRVCRYRWAVIGGFLKEKLEAVTALLPPCVAFKDRVIEENSWITVTVQTQNHRAQCFPPARG
jgi:ribosomal protein L11 methyltransferase